jgi:hypothetical protein
MIKFTQVVYMPNNTQTELQLKSMNQMQELIPQSSSIFSFSLRKFYADQSFYKIHLEHLNLSK